MSALDRATALAEQATLAQRALAAALTHPPHAPLAALAARDPEAASAALRAAILRIVFLLHAEDRGLLGEGAARPVRALFDRLTDSEGRLGPAPDPAQGAPSAWAELAAIFRAATGPGSAPLLEPDADPFLDNAPVDDATVTQVLALLLLHDGASIAYRTLELESIGGVYEALLGLGLQVTRGLSIALRPDHALIDLDALFALAPERRAASIEEMIGAPLGAKASAALRAARAPGDLALALRKRVSPLTPAPLPRGAIALASTGARRRSGSHYTPPALSRAIVRATLAPLLGDSRDRARILGLSVCDPAMGSGAFLLEVCRFLGAELLQASGQGRGEAEAAARLEACRQIAARCLHGVDRDPLAVDLSRISLWLFTAAPSSPRGFLADKLRCGDSLIGAGLSDLDAFPSHALQRDARRRSLRGGPGAAAQSAVEAPAARERDPEALARCLDAWTALWFWPTDDPEAAALAPTPATLSHYLAAAERADPRADPAAERAAQIARAGRFLHWETAFPAVFSQKERGFDAIVGNPPWVAYAGRAAQPLAEATFNFYRRRSPAFFGYRTLHGLFIHRAATLLRPGGRLGLIVPTSVSDLQGYAPARAAHDHLCEPDAALPDFGADAFAGVFQPAMGLLSTRRREPVRASPSWRLVRAELTSEAERLLARLSALPKLPASLFGERGYQTVGDDSARLRATDSPEPPFTIPLREGRDIGPYRRRPPRLHLDPRGIEARIRPLSAWQEVKLLIRQTARYPIAALADGQPFRNSVLAGFASEELSAPFLLCYLNSTPIRWFHFTRYRDARQGMPQVKIAHLRGLPAPPRDGAGRAGEAAAAAWKAELEAIGQAIGERNQGIAPEETEAIDARVAALLDLSDAELALVRAWAADNPLPRPSQA